MYLKFKKKKKQRIWGLKEVETDTRGRGEKKWGTQESEVLGEVTMMTMMR